MAVDVTEQIAVNVPATTVYAAVADVRRMTRWSPECFGVLIWRRTNGAPTRFIGFNRRGWYVWFTSCEVVVAVPGQEFAFDVNIFGLPVARWGYRFAPGAGDGPTPDRATTSTEVTEYWEDRRNRGSLLLGRIFTGHVANDRPAANSEGMRTTLGRLRRELEAV